MGGGAHREGVRRVRGVGELELGRVACQACAGPREREREKTLMGVGGGWMACGGAAVALLSCQKVVWPVAASVAYPPHPCGWPVVVVPRWPAVVMACPPARLPFSGCMLLVAVVELAGDRLRELVGDGLQGLRHRLARADDPAHQVEGVGELR